MNSNNLKRGSLVEYKGSMWKVSGMVYLPDGSVDWYCLVTPEPVKDPYVGMICVGGGLLDASSHLRFPEG